MKRSPPIAGGRRVQCNVPLSEMEDAILNRLVGGGDLNRQAVMRSALLHYQAIKEHPKVREAFMRASREQHRVNVLGEVDVG